MRRRTRDSFVLSAGMFGRQARSIGSAKGGRGQGPRAGRKSSVPSRGISDPRAPPPASPPAASSRPLPSTRFHSLDHRLALLPLPLPPPPPLPLFPLSQPCAQACGPSERERVERGAGGLCLLQLLRQAQALGQVEGGQGGGRSGGGAPGSLPPRRDRLPSSTLLRSIAVLQWQERGKPRWWSMHRGAEAEGSDGVQGESPMRLMEGGAAMHSPPLTTGMPARRDTKEWGLEGGWGRGRGPSVPSPAAERGREGVAERQLSAPAWAEPAAADPTASLRGGLDGGGRGEGGAERGKGGGKLQRLRACASDPPHSAPPTNTQLPPLPLPTDTPPSPAPPSNTAPRMEHRDPSPSVGRNRSKDPKSSASEPPPPPPSAPPAPRWYRVSLRPGRIWAAGHCRQAVPPRAHQGERTVPAPVPTHCRQHSNNRS